MKNIGSNNKIEYKLLISTLDILSNRQELNQDIPINK